MEILGISTFAIVLIVGCFTAVPALKLRSEKGYQNGIGNMLCAIVFGWIYLLYAIGLPLSYEARYADQQQLAKMIAKEIAKRMKE